MLDTTKLDELVRRARAKVTNAFLKAAKNARNEREFQTAASQIIEDFARTAQIDLPVREEYTLFNGRADAVYNRFIIEYEAPGSLRKENSYRHNQHAIGQVKDYLTGLVRRERHKAERLAGVVFNGDFYIWVRQREKTWHIDQPIKVDPTSTERFLRTLCSLSTERALIPENLIEDFGENTNVSRQVVPVLYDLLTSDPPRRTQVLFEQWSTQFSEVCDYDQASKLNVAAHARAYGITGRKVDPFHFFFCIHTYYAYLIKLLAIQIVHFYLMPKLGTDLRQAATKPSDELRKYLAAMENGGIFRQLGINNLMEADMFGWYLDVWCPQMAEAAREVINTLGNYAVDTLDIDPDSSRDLLKHLYQNLMPKALRHNLGEYYTPDWLAERTLALLDGVKEEVVREAAEAGKTQSIQVYRGDPRKRILDPACGSGTFLVMAIRRIKNHAWQNAIPEQETLRLILRNVMGFDLNPLAVVSARTNYLLALGDLLQHRGPEEINIPVYLCDSILTPGQGTQLWEQHKYSFNTSVGQFSVPACLVEARKIDTLANLVEESVNIGRTPEEFRNEACRQFALTLKSHQREIRTLDELYAKLCHLKEEGINGIWARVIKNAFAPLFAGRFDFIAGNPPWINWEHLPEQYRDATKPLWEEYGLFTLSGWRARMGGGKKDISMLMFYVAVDKYLKDAGRIGFVITQTVFKTEGGGEGFRRFRLGENGVPIWVRWLDDFSALKPFEGAANRTAVVLAQKGRPTRYPVEVGYWRKRRKGGPLPESAPLDQVATELCRTSRWQAQPIDDARANSPWITGRPKSIRAAKRIVGPSAYQARAGCCTWLNGVYWVEPVAQRPDGLVVVANCGDIGKKKVDSIEKAVECEAVYSLLRGQDVSRWRADPSLQILLAQDETADASRALDEETVRRQMPHLYEYFKHFEPELRERSGYKKYLSDQPFYAVYNCGKHVFAPWKVAWRYIATDMTCAVVGPNRDGALSQAVVPDCKLMLIPCQCQDEAHFVCGVLNSAPSAYIVKSYGISTQLAPHILKRIPLPRYSEKSDLHKAIAKLSRSAHKRALCKDDDAVAQCEAEIDELTAELWRLSKQELRGIRQSLRDLAE